MLIRILASFHSVHIIRQLATLGVEVRTASVYILDVDTGSTKRRLTLQVARLIRHEVLRAVLEARVGIREGQVRTAISCTLHSLHD